MVSDPLHIHARNMDSSSSENQLMQDSRYCTCRQRRKYGRQKEVAASFLRMVMALAVSASLILHSMSCFGFVPRFPTSAITARKTGPSSLPPHLPYYTLLYQKPPSVREETGAGINRSSSSGNSDRKAGDEETETSDSYGSLLMRMKNSEEALLKANHRQANISSLEEEQQQQQQHPLIELDPIRKVKRQSGGTNDTDVSIAEEAAMEAADMAIPTTDETTPTEIVAEAESPSDLLPGMDFETAKELDDSVIPLKGPRAAHTVQVLPLSPLYSSAVPRTTIQDETASKKATATAAPPSTTTTTPLPLSRPEHYRDHIGRDRRLLAVSIAATTETVAQWRLFCQEQGGLYPILETIREGARAFAVKQQQEIASDDDDPQQRRRTDRHEEETFRAACSACRALRDLCAISPELAAVITDGVLRANAVWQSEGDNNSNSNSLMDDFCSILRYAAAGEYYRSTAGGALDVVLPSSGGNNMNQARIVQRFRRRRDTRLRCKLYVTQLLLAMVVASDDAVAAIRETEGLSEAVLSCSSYAQKEQARRWLRYPGEMVKWLWRGSKWSGKRRGDKEAQAAETTQLRRPFMEAASVGNDLSGEVQRSSNQILAAIGYNKWIPRNPGQRGLRILSLDGGGSRGMVSITAVNEVMQSVGNGADVADSFDMIVGTSTGGIIAFLVGLLGDSSEKAVERYSQLIKQIFIKSALSTPMMLFTTASYDEVYFMEILVNILKENSMLDSRADPAVPLVCALTSKMSSTPTHVALFRNYNYAGGELPDPFTIDPEKARIELELPLELEHEVIRRGDYRRRATGVSKSRGSRSGSGSRHPGSFRVLQRYALRASTAAPTFFKPVMMAGEMYCDGGIVASNPAAVAIHEARSLYPDIPIELVVSVGTGAFIEQKSAPRVGWDGIIGQIVNSATDGEQVHHVLEDLLGEPAILGRKKTAVAKTRYFRFNPVIGKPDEFPIDVTDPVKLKKLRKITKEYMGRPEQEAKVERIADILKGRKGRRRRMAKALTRKQYSK